MRVAVTGWSLVSPVAGDGFDVRGFLRRRKDRKLLARATELAIPAAREALGDLPAASVGLFLGVGREPPEDATEAAILASEVDGALDAGRLGREGLAQYPPLASLRTLPNLVLAHVAIQLGLRGPGGTVAGDGSAGLAAIVAGAEAIQDGRCDVVLAGGADSRLHPALVRDQRRRGLSMDPGEAAALVRLESEPSAAAGGRPVLAWLEEAVAGFAEPAVEDPGHWCELGWCGAADGAVAAVRRLAEGGPGTLRLADPVGGCATISWSVPPESLRT